jgi:nitroimidazol reductase NimA-like FMN-containing flavoprotein (pyridoxamine 5'-phosphate oxidase superfamily)
MTAQPRRSYEERRAQAEQFLRDHRSGIFATGKRDGSPQQSFLGYRLREGDIVIATGDSTAKVKNARKNPRVSLAVSDGPTCVVVYGEARLLQGADAETYLGEPPGNGSQPGTPTLIVFTPDTWRWARLDG